MRTLGIVDDMPFGKFKGQNIGELIDKEPRYMHWLLNQRGQGIFDQETERFIDNAEAELHANDDETHL